MVIKLSLITTTLLVVHLDWAVEVLLGSAHEKRWRDSFFEQFQRHGFEAPIQWYKATIEDVQYEAEVKVPLDRYKIQVPLLFVGCTKDANNRPDMIEISRRAGLLPNLHVKQLDCGHWSPMKSPVEVSTHHGLHYSFAVSGSVEGSDPYKACYDESPAIEGQYTYNFCQLSSSIS